MEKINFFWNLQFVSDVQKKHHFSRFFDSQFCIPEKFKKTQKNIKKKLPLYVFSKSKIVYGKWFLKSSSFFFFSESLFWKRGHILKQCLKNKSFISGHMTYATFYFQLIYTFTLLFLWLFVFVHENNESRTYRYFEKD